MQELFLILDKEAVGEMLVWWRPKGAGYTVCVDKAGRYSLEEARSRCDGKRSVAIPEHVAIGLSVPVVPVDVKWSICKVDHLSKTHRPKWLKSDKESL